MRQGRESLPRAFDCRREVGVSTGGLCDDRIVEQILPQPGLRYRPDRQRLPRVEVHSHVHNRAGHRKVPSPVSFGARNTSAQFTPGSRITRRPLPPPTSAREYTPARSADRHRPEAHCCRLSILSPVVTATGTTFCAA